MAEKISTNPLAQSILIFMICTVGILAFLLMIIVPSQKTEAELDARIDELKARIEEQRILTPVFHSLLNRAKMASPSELPSPEKTKLTHGDMDEISKVFQDLAARYNLKLEEMATDVNSMMQDSGYLLMRIRLSGDFYRFRDFLIDLGGIPSLEHIEEVDIRSAQKSKEMWLKIWLAQE